MADQQVESAPAGLDEPFLREFSARWHAAWNARDPTALAALCTDDVEVVDPSLPGPQRGPDVLPALMATLRRAFPDYRFEESEPPYASSTRAKAIVPWRFSGTMTGPLEPPGFGPTGRRVEFHGDDHWSFRGTRVERCEILYDANAIGIQLGAVPPPGSPGERLAVVLQRAQASWRRRRPAGG